MADIRAFLKAERRSAETQQSEAAENTGYLSELKAESSGLGLEIRKRRGWERDLGDAGGKKQASREPSSSG